MTDSNLPPADPIVIAIIDQQPTDAIVSLIDQRWVLHLSREFDQDVDRLWKKLTEPDELASWSPIVPDRPLISAGPATARETLESDPVDVEVLVADRPRELVHRWGPQLLRWTLQPTPGGSRLTLEHTFEPEGMAATFAAGWHICLAVLAAVLDGNDVERVVGQRATDYGWRALEAAYHNQLDTAITGR
jgi:uncharacterized protein YndB with AHSA1/START domain